jgi:hypothetical protein
MESLALVASIILVYFVSVGPLALVLPFAAPRLPDWLHLVVGFVAIASGLYALVGLGHISVFLWAGLADLGCGLFALYWVFSNLFKGDT